MKNRIILIISLAFLATSQVLQADSKKQASQESDFTQSKKNYMNYSAAGVNSSAY